ncbi:MAG: hypothetical protein IPM39_04675 [Chloroflexi bacterium]|nr:hypothetical protein [Chloroflexota bacterium]
MTYFLASFKEFIGNEALMFALKPLLAMTIRLLALPQRSGVEGFRIGNATGIDLVLQYVAHGVFTDGFFILPQLLNDAPPVHPLSDGQIAMLPCCIHAKGTTNDSGLPQINMQSRLAFFISVVQSDQVIA